MRCATTRCPAGRSRSASAIDAGSLNEKDAERGYAHLIEHLTFRESKYLANGQAIPTWQRLGARLGADTNAITSPTETVYKLDLPDAALAKLDESVKLLSGMIREPALSEANITAEVPIVLAEKRDGGGPSPVRRCDERVVLQGPAARRTARRAAPTPALTGRDQRQAQEPSTSAGTGPENTVIVIAGDGNPADFAALIEHYFGDWKPAGQHLASARFRQAEGARGRRPGQSGGRDEGAGRAGPAAAAWWSGSCAPGASRPTISNTTASSMIDRVARSIINRRLEEHARAGGDYRPRRCRPAGGQPFQQCDLHQHHAAGDRLEGRAQGCPRGDRRCAGDPAERGRNRPRTCPKSTSLSPIATSSGSTSQGSLAGGRSRRRGRISANRSPRRRPSSTCSARCAPASRPKQCWSTAATCSAAR